MVLTLAACWSGSPCVPETACEGDRCWSTMCGGAFTMGRDIGRTGDDEGPAHAVTLRPFAIMTREVTVAEVQDCVAAGACRPLPDRPLCRGPGERAAGCLDWSGARDVCAHLGGRLPTEAEWEFAATRGGTSRMPWGDAAPDCTSAVLGCGVCPDEVLQVPCSKGDAPLCDPIGNAIEWVQDAWAESYAGAPVDGSAREGGRLRVLRGGGVGSCSPADPRARTAHPPTFSYGGSGARCAR